MKYIFIVGAPGSKWSSIAKTIYFSPDIDRTDASPDREYWHSAWGEPQLMHTDVNSRNSCASNSNLEKPQLMHIGAYFDPGMEFGKYFDRLDQYSRDENEREFNRPFTGSGVRIIKSHVFAHHIDYIKQTWPDCPIVLVERSDDDCLNWWIKTGGFETVYPDYKEYYQNLSVMAKRIKEQNIDIRKAQVSYPGHPIDTNITLSKLLKITTPPFEYFQNYMKIKITVTLI